MKIIAFALIFCLTACNSPSKDDEAEQTQIAETNQKINTMYYQLGEQHQLEQDALNNIQ